MPESVPEAPPRVNTYLAIYVAANMAESEPFTLLAD
jgi:hypothetical protein